MNWRHICPPEKFKHCCCRFLCNTACSGAVLEC
jgi:hypothetical protein